MPPFSREREGERERQKAREKERERETLGLSDETQAKKIIGEKIKKKDKKLLQKTH
jgi:hypothetical protein